MHRHVGMYARMHALTRWKIDSMILTRITDKIHDNATHTDMDKLIALTRT